MASNGSHRLELHIYLLQLQNIDFTVLMRQWMSIIDNDNRRGVLAGLDKDGNPMRPVSYRPVGTPRKTTRRQRNNARSDSRYGVFSGLGPAAAGLHNNLTEAEYKRLDGPPLAPRRQSSRVITNLVTEFNDGGVANGHWEVRAGWKEVVDVKGEPFLPAAFRIRDLRGVRPQGREEAHKAMRLFVDRVFRTR